MTTDLDNIRNELYNGILTAINESPLTDEVKQESIAAIESESQRIKARLDSLIFKAPEVIEGYITSTSLYILELISPVFKKHNVLTPNGQDVHRHIYKRLGGSKPVTYEIK